VNGKAITHKVEDSSRASRRPAMLPYLRWITVALACPVGSNAISAMDLLPFRPVNSAGVAGCARENHSSAPGPCG